MAATTMYLMMVLAMLWCQGSLAGSLREMREEEVAHSLQLTPAQRAFAAVPASARTGFLLYQLASAINSNNSPWSSSLLPWFGTMPFYEQIVEQEQQVDSNWLTAMANEFQGYSIPDGFSTDLLTWITNTSGLTPVDIYRSIASRSSGGQRGRSVEPSAAVSGSSQIVCSAQGQCYELSSFAAVCCPF